MKIIKPSYEILNKDKINGNEVLKQIEKIGRVCYKSEDRITKNSANKFIKMLIDRGHEAMIEHFSFSVKFICDRGVSHELVRSRIASFAQESTRYCSYNKDKFGRKLTFIDPCFWEKGSYMYNIWENSMMSAEDVYMDLIDNGAKPEEARSILPNSLKTEIVQTMNLREWRHFLKLRTHITAHPQMREVTIPLLRDLKVLIPVVFDDIKLKD